MKLLLHVCLMSLCMFSSLGANGYRFNCTTEEELKSEIERLTINQPPKEMLDFSGACVFIIGYYMRQEGIEGDDLVVTRKAIKAFNEKSVKEVIKLARKLEAEENERIFGPLENQ